MSDKGTSVTLIFYRVGDAWWREPALNLLAAAAQMSSYTHVEIAIGEVLPALTWILLAEPFPGPHTSIHGNSAQHLTANN